MWLGNDNDGAANDGKVKRESSSKSSKQSFKRGSSRAERSFGKTTERKSWEKEFSTGATGMGCITMSARMDNASEQFCKGLRQSKG